MSNTNTPLILITNDDNIYSKGIYTLTKLMSTIGHVIVIAPEKNHSGMGHAVTQDIPLRISPSKIFHKIDPSIESYICTGTPADCVIAGKSCLFNKKKPDLVVSGINHGKNASISVIYSGTMAAALESTFEGIPSIGFSLQDFDMEADFSHIETYVLAITKKILQQKINTRYTALNVNFPKKQKEPIQGIKICKQADIFWKNFLIKKKNPKNQNYFWMSEQSQQKNKKQDTDEWALSHNYVSIVPCQYDLTAHHMINDLQNTFAL